jgi:hypothetical protein
MENLSDAALSHNGNRRTTYSAIGDLLILSQVKVSHLTSPRLSFNSYGFGGESWSPVSVGAKW